MTSLAPPLVLGSIVVLTDRRLAAGPIAVWMSLAACAAVLRHVAGVHELEQTHEQALWLASHDPDTDMLLPHGLHASRSPPAACAIARGTVVVVEALGLDDLRTTHGYDAVDHVVTTVATQLRNAVGDGRHPGAGSRTTSSAAFMRSADLARGRQVADVLQRSLLGGTHVATASRCRCSAVVGVAQADGCGDRRARRRAPRDRCDARAAAHTAPGFIAIDADLTGSIDPRRPRTRRTTIPTATVAAAAVAR